MRNARSGPAVRCSACLLSPSVHGSFAVIPILQIRRQRLRSEVAWQRQTAHGEWGNVVPTPPQRGPPELLLPKTACLLSFISFGCAGSSPPRGLLSSGEQGLLSGCRVRASHCGGSSGCRARALERMGSVVAAHVLRCPAACGVLVL